MDRPEKARVTGGGRFREPLLIIPLLLAALVAAVYWQTGGYPFLTFDDPYYVTGNPIVARGMTLDGAKSAFTGFLVGNWHPLTILSLMVDVELFGLRPGAFHLENAALHLANSLLLFLLLRGATGTSWRSGLVAALFAVHPLHVESVAWISSRKDLLCALFWFLSAMCWLSYCRSGGRWRYLLSLFLFSLSLLSKPMAVSFPLTLLVLEFWPLGRIAFPPNTGRGAPPPAITLRRSLLEKVPFLALSAAFSCITVLAQAESGAMAPMEIFPVWARLGNAAMAYLAYLWKTVWPAGLALLYPHPVHMPGGVPWGRVALSAAILIGGTLVVFQERTRRPYLFAGWFFYLATLLPAIGIVQVGGQSMADRYAYIPLVGIFLAGVHFAGETLSGRSTSIRGAAMAAVIGVVCLLAAAAFRQTALWSHNETLYRHTLASTGPNPEIRKTLGEYLVANGRFGEAESQVSEALRIQPSDVIALDTLGRIRTSLGDYEGGAALFRKAVSVQPAYAVSWNNLGTAARMTGKAGEARSAFENAVRTDPSYLTGWYNLATFQASSGDYAGAAVSFRRVVRILPSHDLAWINLAGVLLFQGKNIEAIEAAREAVRLSPESTAAWHNLKIAAERLGRKEEAREAEVRLKEMEPGS